MNIGGEVGETLQLSRAEIPIELRNNFAGLRHIPLFYVNYARKVNRTGKVQTRVIIITLDHIYMCHPNGDINRCFPFSWLEQIFHDPVRQHIAFIVPKEYDAVVCLSDCHHLIHVVETLRSLHESDAPLVVRVIARPPVTAKIPGSVDGGSLADASKSDDGTKPLSLWGRFMNKLRPRKRGVISGWNDQWKDDPNPTNRPGHPDEMCIGRGVYAVSVTKPPGFVLSLHNDLTCLDMDDEIEKLERTMNSGMGQDGGDSPMFRRRRLRRSKSML